MKPTIPSVVRRLALAGVLGAAALSPTDPAVARERGPYEMQILVDGVPLERYSTRGRTYVEALEGRDYSIRFHNRTGGRVAVALSVDGLNVIDAKTTTAGQASKWIVGPWETLTLDGWQVGPSTARRFFFTTEERSYGAWLGKTANLGVISAAVFRERIPYPAPIHQSPLRKSELPRSKRSPEPSARAEDAAGMGRDASAQAPEGARRESTPVEAEGDLAATGIGDKLEHRVRKVHFDAEPTPAATLEVRYEYHDALVKLGVLPRHYSRRDDPLQRRERAHGFEGMEFAPDPHR